MCLPKPPQPVAPISQVPSMQAASGLELGDGNAPRGAAQLGRLALRFAGPSSAASRPATSPVIAPAAPAPPGPRQAITADYAGVGSSPGSLAGLRFGNYTAPFTP